MNYVNFQVNYGEKIKVSRETFEKLEIYAYELARWNPKINLVAGNSIITMWERHFVDSMQILSLLAGTPRKWLDLGSGGGFPGLVLATCLPETEFTLIESDIRKCTFLRHIAREMEINVTVIPKRIDAVQTQHPDIISARALAPLDMLIEISKFHAKNETIFIFPKGKNWMNELTIAKESWQMIVENHQSITDSDAQILILKDIHPHDFA